MTNDITPIHEYKKYWAECFGTAPFLPTSRKEMDALGWDSCDIIIVTGDAYVDHPSFGMAIIGRLLEAQGFRVGIIAQPEWNNKDAFMQLGKPNLFFGITAGNMDSMINRYTADKNFVMMMLTRQTTKAENAQIVQRWCTRNVVVKLIKAHLSFLVVSKLAYVA